MTKPDGGYADLEARFNRIGAIGEAAGVLHWDHAVNMPPGGADARAEQLATLKLIGHEMITDPAMEDLLERAAEEVAGDPWRSANVREMRRQWVHAACVDADLVEALSKAESVCELAWRRARKEDDFAEVEPHLASVLGMVREVGAAKAAVDGIEEAGLVFVHRRQPDGTWAEEAVLRLESPEERDLFVSLGGAYHGDTIGAVSVGGVDLFHSVYSSLLFPTLRSSPFFTHLTWM